MSNFSRKMVAAVAASTITLATATMGAPSVLAQESPSTPSGVPATPSESTSVDRVNPDAQVTLNIRKFEGDPVAGPGETADTSGLKPLNDVQFKIERIEGVDLTTATGWSDLAAMTPADLKGKTARQIGTVTTNDSGLATINTAGNSEFKVGAYRVTEVQKDGYTVAPPFLIALPYSGADGKWTYERTVFPKNQNTTPNKQVDASKASLGSNMDYTINAPVPAGALNRFEISDPLVEQLELQPQSVKVSADGVELAPGDYNVTTETNTVKVVFTSEGLKKLQDARKNNPAMQVHVAFAAKVVSLPENGQINNTATVSLPNGGQVTTDIKGPDNTNQPTNTTFGNLTITKTANAETDPKLDGAEFEVYRCEQKDGKWSVLGDALRVATTNRGDQLNTKLTTGATSERKSTANAYGIPISTTSGGAVGTVTFDYCAVETKAPSGFVRDPEPRHITVDTQTRAMTVSVDNKKDSVLGQLPATGAWGIVLIFLLGAALLARGLYTSFRDNKDEARA